MTDSFIFIVAVVIGVIGVFIALIDKQGVRIWRYQYKRKDFFMTAAEHECYNALMAAVGDTYYVFPQVHLPTIVDHKIARQNWQRALWHINSKSVDFVLCDKAYIAPKLAIELDDRSHLLPERQERDREVERILRIANMPLLRIENHGRFNSAELKQKISDALNNDTKVSP